MSTKQIDYLNIGLIFLAGAIAYLLPFRLFLFAYAILGPLHYLTEISWLHDRDYFMKKKRYSLLLWGLGLFFFFVPLFIDVSDALFALLGYLAFSFAFLSALDLKTNVQKFWSISILLLIAFFFWQMNWFALIFSALIFTIIHVFVFTACFMLFGASKERSKTGYLSVLILFIVGASFFVLPQTGYMFNLTPYVIENFILFDNLVLNIVSVLGMSATIDSLFSTELFPALQFISFAYTYHYLNWFSKTSVIGWHKINKKRVLLIISLWLFSMLLYLYNYALGLFLLFFLSVTHVLLEFPLNGKSFVGIYKSLKS